MCLSCCSLVGGSSVVPAADAVEQAVWRKQELLDALEEIGDRLPPNTLDQLIDALGGTEKVAEVRIISNWIRHNHDLQYPSDVDLYLLSVESLFLSCIWFWIMQKRYNSLTQIQLYNLNLTFSYWISFSSILCCCLIYPLCCLCISRWLVVRVVWWAQMTASSTSPVAR